MKLQIGCFDMPLEGWYNTDVTPHLVIARIPLLARIMHAVGALDDLRYGQHQAGIFRKVHYLNATQRLPFTDNSVDAAYSSHLFENFSREQTLRCAREVHRVLKSGSIFRVAVPDLDAMIKSYDPANPDALVRKLYQPDVKGAKNRMHWLYNANSLKALLEQAGLRDVNQCARFRGKCPDVEKLDYQADSFFMEGTK